MRLPFHVGDEVYYIQKGSPYAGIPMRKGIITSIEIRKDGVVYYRIGGSDTLYIEEYTAEYIAPTERKFKELYRQKSQDYFEAQLEKTKVIDLE